MAVFIFTKVQGGVKFEKEGAGDIKGFCNGDVPEIDLNEQSEVIIRIRKDPRFKINVMIDTVTIDKSAIGGGSLTHLPNTDLNADQLQDLLIDLFNPYSNFMMP